MAEFGGALYAAVESEGPAQIWCSFGGDWIIAVSDGFGDSHTTAAGGLAEFAGYLYAGAGSTVDGALIFRTNDGESWHQLINPGFGDRNNQKIEAVFVFQNHLYASTKNTHTGIEIWRSANGAQWEQVNQDGFGDGHNTSSNWSNASAHFLSQLYAGTSNVVDGGELWRLQLPYGVALSPDQAKLGLASQTVAYGLTLTNTGSITDSFDLTTTGQTWTATLSTLLVTLAPAATASFTVAVAIPPGATGQQNDMVTVTAISRGDGSKTASTRLTTTAVIAPVYSVILSGDASLAGLSSQTVTYSLTVTNTGTVVDTVDLLMAGNTWATALSAPSVTLAAGGGHTVAAMVLIPPTAAALERDQVVIQARSRHDTSKNDTALLTTVSIGPLVSNHLPLIMNRPQ